MPAIRLPEPDPATPSSNYRRLAMIAKMVALEKWTALIHQSLLIAHLTPIVFEGKKPKCLFKLIH
jgi:hypothetical protein